MGTEVHLSVTKKWLCLLNQKLVQPYNNCMYGTEEKGESLN